MLRAILATITLCLIASLPAEARTRHHYRPHAVAPSPTKEILAARRDVEKLRREVAEFKRELAEVKDKQWGPLPAWSRDDGAKRIDLEASLTPIAPEPPIPSALIASTFAALSVPDVREFPDTKPKAVRPSEESRLAVAAGGGVNKDLVAVLHEASRFLPEGYYARIESGVRRGGHGYHPRHLAADVRIYNADHQAVGGPRGWYQSPKTFRLYEQFAQSAKLAQVRLFPHASFTWGGYFHNRGPGSYGFADLMHMQWGGPMGGGTWARGATGVTLAWLRKGGGESAGIADSKTMLASADPTVGLPRVTERPRIRRAKHHRSRKVRRPHHYGHKRA